MRYKYIAVSKIATVGECAIIQGFEFQEIRHDD